MEYADTEELAKIEAGQISNRIFERVNENCTEHCKPLVPCTRELHNVVVPKGSPRSIEHRELYSDMKRVFEKARDSINAVSVYAL